MSQQPLVRLAGYRDIDELLRLEGSAWPDGTRATGGKLIERLEVHPEGFLVAERGTGILGALTSQRVAWRRGERARGWEIATNSGRIRATHQPTGNALYIVSVGVAASHQNQGIGSALVRKAQLHATTEGLDCVLLDSRVPGYAVYAHHIPILEYVFALDTAGEPIDPELRFYLRLGFTIESPASIIRDCMRNDNQSANYGVRMVWYAPG